MRALVLFLAIAAALGGLAFWFTQDPAPPPELDTASTATDEDASNPGDRMQTEGEEAPVAERTSIVEATTQGEGVAATGPSVRITGRVVDADGTAISDAEVRLRAPLNLAGGLDAEVIRAQLRERDANAVKTTTDGQGEFELVSRTSGASLTVKAKGYLVLRETVAKTEDETVDLGLLTVERGAVVRGRVVDRNGAGIGDAEVLRRTNSSGSMAHMEDLEFAGMSFSGSRDDGNRSRADGTFELANFRPGEFALAAKHPDFPTARLADLEVAAGGTLDGLILVMDSGATIAGQITGLPADAEKIQVLARIKPAKSSSGGPEGMVFAMLAGEGGGILGGGALANRSTEPDEQGRFSITGLDPEETYQVWAVQTARSFVETTTCSDKLEAAPGAQGLVLRYEPGISVTFRVVDDASGAPIERLWVNKRLEGGRSGMFSMLGMGDNAQMKEYPGGVVTIANLRPKKRQKLQLTIEAKGFGTFEREKIELPREGALDLGTLRLGTIPELTVVAKDSSGAPVAGARVVVRAAEKKGNTSVNFVSSTVIEHGDSTHVLSRNSHGTHHGVTDAAGRCTVNGFPGEAAIVTIEEDAFAPYESEPFTQPLRKPDEFQATLDAGGTVDVLVLGSDAQPISDIRVRHRDPDGSTSSNKTDARGIAHFTRLPSGVHGFKLGKRGRGDSFQISMSSTVSIGGEGQGKPDPSWEELDVTAGGTHSLQLTKAAGAAVAGIVRENGVPLTRARVAFLQGQAKPDGREGVMADLHAQVESFGDGSSSSSTKTDVDGAYRLEEVSAGQHRLRITHPDRSMPTEIPVVLGAGDNHFDVDLTTTWVRGIVRDQDGNAVSGARVSVATAQEGASGASAAYRVMGDIGFSFGGREGERSDSDGTFELRGVQADRPLVVKARAKGFAEGTSEEFEVAEGASAEGVQVTVLASGSVTVRTSAEMQFGIATASWQGEGDVSPVTSMLRNGKVTLDGLRTGRWEIQLNGANSNSFDPQTVDVVAGETLTVDF